MNRKLGLLRTLLPIVLALAGASPARSAPAPGGSSSCLSSLANRIASDLGLSGTYNVELQRADAWAWIDDGNGGWKEAYAKGYAIGVHEGTTTIWVWPKRIGSLAGGVCSPQFQGAAYIILAHELLHFVCPPHDVPDNPDPSTPPPTPPEPPDCNDLNYAIHSAAAVCGEIGRISGCCADMSASGCEDLDGMSFSELQAYCAALKQAYGKAQDRFNDPENAETAFQCKCADGWEPGDEGGGGYPNCPPMPPPPGGCEGDASTAYPNNELIPDCAHSCPQSPCPEVSDN